ncbi:MAG: FliM/FliN family flagellar motor switch protein [Phycisphaerae bacterium]|nr:FliM/FliN family flagellar motor switch protein [Phycisphaerae bacterium]
MSKLSVDTLSSFKIRQLLSAVGSKGSPQTEKQPVVSAYDWRQPRLSTAQRAKLKAFADTVAAECTKEFIRFYPCTMRVSLADVRLCLPDALKAPNPEDTSAEYRIGFGPDAGQLCGWICIPMPSALLWTSRILGDKGQIEDAGRKLSGLEESLLLDMAGGLIQAFSQAYGKNLVSHACFSSGPTAAQKEPDALCQIVLDVQQPDHPNETASFYFVIGCDKVRAVTGGSEERKTAAPAAAMMREHICNLPVTVTVRLADASLCLKDIMNLEVNDVVLLGKKTAEPVELLWGDKILFYGLPAQTGQHRAVVIIDKNSK